VGEPAKRAADHSGHSGPDGVRELGGAVAQGLDRESQVFVARRARDREGVPVPAVQSFEEEHGELAGREAHWPPEWLQAISRMPFPTGLTVCTW
jgi:hypothetical protein